MKKRFGQHFLSDRSILRRIVDLARIQPADTVVEIGPGAGSLTFELAAAAKHVIAIEIDADLIPALREKMPGNVDIIQGDALEAAFPKKPFHLVGNLPYNVATPLLRKFIQHRDNILDVTVMVQKEVAERLIAKPRTHDYGPLSVLVQYYAKVTYGFTAPSGAFTPKPKVDSAVVRLDWHPNTPPAVDFTDFVHQAFASRRKKLANNLLHMFPSASRENIQQKLQNAEVSFDARPEELGVADFLRVYNQFR